MAREVIQMGEPIQNILWDDRHYVHQILNGHSVDFIFNPPLPQKTEYGTSLQYEDVGRPSYTSVLREFENLDDWIDVIKLGIKTQVEAAIKAAAADQENIDPAKLAEYTAARVDEAITEDLAYIEMKKMCLKILSSRKGKKDTKIARVLEIDPLFRFSHKYLDTDLEKAIQQMMKDGQRKFFEGFDVTEPGAWEELAMKSRIRHTKEGSNDHGTGNYLDDLKERLKLDEIDDHELAKQVRESTSQSDYDENFDDYQAMALELVKRTQFKSPRIKPAQ